MGKDLNGKELGKGYSQRKNGDYNFRFVDRFGKRNVIYDKKINALKKKAKEIVAKDTLKLNMYNSKTTCNEFYDLTIKNFRVDDLNENTINVYNSAYSRHIRNTPLGNMAFVNITPIKLKKVLSELSKSYSQSICGTIRSVFLGMYDIAVLEGIVPCNFVNSLKVKSKIETKVVLPMTVEFQSKFTKYCQESFFGNVYVLALNTGMRISEIIGLSLKDIDFVNNIIHVRRQLNYKNYNGTFENGSKYRFSKPKYNSVRDVPINATAKKAIEDQIIMLTLIKQNKLQTNNQNYKHIEEFDDLLFLSRTGTPLYQSMININLHKIMDTMREYESNIPEKNFGIHVLRHTFATRCAELGVNPNTLKEIMGHKNINVTMNVYVSVKTKAGDTNILDSLVVNKNKNGVNENTNYLLS